MTNRPEQTLHRQVAQFLDMALPATAFFCHVPNGGKRGKVEAAIFKSLGVKAGTPDLLIVWQGRCFWIELKSATGRLSNVQRGLLNRLRSAGCETAICRSLEHVMEQLDVWGIPTRGRIAA